MKTLKLSLGAALIALATGCSLQPVYQQPHTAMPASYPGGTAYAGQPAGASAADTGWRTFLGDPRLQRLVELGLKNNHDLRIAMLNVERVRAQYRIARAAQAPQLDASIGDSASHSSTNSGSKTIGTSHTYSAGLALSWEADFFGRLSSLSDSALQQYLASGHARQAAEILLVSQIADQYLTTLGSAAQLQLTQHTLDAAQASYQLVKLQFDAGTVSELDLRLARTAVDQANSNYQSQLRQQAQADNALVLLIGAPLPADLPPAPQLGDDFIMADIPAGLPAELLQRRPDILQAEATLRSEHADIGAARAAFFPSLSLTASAGTQSAALSSLFGAGTGIWSFVPALTMPIFNSGANQANLDVATVNRDIGVAQYQKTVETAFREVADGLAARTTYQQELASHQQETTDQQRRLELENMLYKNGVDSYQNVLSAQIALYAAQQSLLTARVNQLTSRVDLYRALGGGWKQN